MEAITVSTLFDLNEAKAARDAGMASAVQHSGIPWVDYATEYVRCYLLEHRFLFCDDVWEHGLIRPESPRAFGQVMKNAIRYGWMTVTDQARQSAQSNNSLRSVYRSEIFSEAASPMYPPVQDWCDNIGSHE